MACCEYTASSRLLLLERHPEGNGCSRVANERPLGGTALVRFATQRFAQAKFDTPTLVVPTTQNRH